MLIPGIILVLFLGWLAAFLYLFELVDQARLHSPRPTWPGFFIWYGFRIYTHLVHHLIVTGTEHLKARKPGEPLLIVSNHTGSADVILLQATVPFEIRWMMWNDSALKFLIRMLSAISPLILVEQDGKDVAPIREAMRELKKGGIIGIFPEGGIERPPQTVIPFFDGVGLLVRRTGALVIPVWIHGTPKVNIATDALFKFSRAHLDILPPQRFDPSATPEEITASLRNLIKQKSGWPDGPPAPTVSPTRP